MVYGSRFLTRKASRVLYFYHFLANQFLTFLSNLLTNRNMTDIETGYKAFLSGAIKPLHLTSRGFGMEIEITAMICKTNARTYEVPISYYGRSYEEGKKIGVKDGIMAIYYIIYYNLIHCFTPMGRRYIDEVNRFLAAHSIRGLATRRPSFQFRTTHDFGSGPIALVRQPVAENTDHSRSDDASPLEAFSGGTAPGKVVAAFRPLRTERDW